MYIITHTSNGQIATYYCETEDELSVALIRHCLDEISVEDEYGNIVYTQPSKLKK